VLSTIQSLVNERYPGVVIESPVQGWAFLDEFERGIETHKSLLRPTALDDRWLGVCYFQLVQDMNAMEAFYRAIVRGDEATRINLANLFMFIDRTNKAFDELQRVKITQLNTYDRVLYFRVRSLLEERNTNLTTALSEAEEAWRHVQGAPEFPLLAPKVLSQLAVLQGRIGRSQRALWYLERSLEIASGKERFNNHVVQAHVLISLGRYSEALEALDRLDIGTNARHLAAEELWIRGDAARALNQTKQAIDYYQRGTDIAIAHESTGEEFMCRLSLVAVFGRRSYFETANEHLIRAKMLISDRSDSLAYRFRETLLKYWEGSTTAENAQESLQVLMGEYEQMNLLQEQGWVRLHLAELYRQQNDPRYIKELDALQALSETLQNRAFLAREWTLLPELREVAAKTHPKIAGKPPVVLEVYTMGQEKLVLSGKIVNIRLRRAVEILAYFLEHKQVDLKRLMLDIFPDEKPSAARSYFHQFRHELHERVPGLGIEYDAEQRTYLLKSELDILWDVGELRAGRKMGEQGIFLPGSGSEWVNVLDQSLDALRDAPPILVERFEARTEM
jgi:tetratricopeptide (TPR) repeat protein